MFKIEFKTDNATFAEQPEVEIKSILLKVVKDLYNHNLNGVIRESNGNTIGKWELK